MSDYERQCEAADFVHRYVDRKWRIRYGRNPLQAILLRLRKNPNDKIAKRDLQEFKRAMRKGEDY